MLNIGIIGAGDIACKNYLPGLHDPERGITLRAVCDIVPERAEAAREFGAETIYTDHKEMLKDDQIDVVIVLTPVATHPPFMMDALYAGKHVYTEKPLGLTRNEADAVCELAEAQQKLAMSAPLLMLYPEFQWLKQTVQGGATGDVLFVRAHSSHGGANRGMWNTDSGAFFKEETAGKMPPLYDMGVYGLTILTHCLGPVQRVSAMAGIGVKDRVIDKVAIPNWQPYTVHLAVPDNTGLLLDFGNACFAVLDGSFCLPYIKGPQYEFYGYEGSIYFENNAVELISERPDFAAPGEKPVSWHKHPMPDTMRLPEPLNWGRILTQHIKKCLETSATPIVTANHARHVTEIMEKAALAVATGRTQEIVSKP